MYGCKVINKAIEESEKDKLYQEWLVVFPNMKKPITFDEFYDRSTGKNIDTRPTQTLLDEVQKIKIEMEG